MGLGIDPKVDFAFKLVFGSPDHTRVTIHFLNAVMKLARPITWVEILNPIQGKDRAEDKLVVLDVLAKDGDGRRYNIEMQTSLPTSLCQRLTYYNCLSYIRQLGAGEAYYKLCPAVSICVLDQVLFAEAEPFHLSFRLRCDQRDLVLSDDLVFHLLELPKYRPASDNVQEKDPLEKWAYFLRHAEQLDAEDLTSRLVDEAFKEAIGVLEMISRTPEDRQFYEARQKFLHDEQARLIAAREQGRDEGRVEGRQEGREEGRVEGREEGAIQGELIGQIRILQEIIGDDVSSSAELLQQSPAELNRLVDELRKRLRSRGN